MKTLPLSEVKTKLSGLMDEVLSTDEEVVITKSGRPAAVLVSANEHESWKETIPIQSDPALMNEIKAGLAALKSRKAKLWRERGWSSVDGIIGPGPFGSWRSGRSSRSA